VYRAALLARDERKTAERGLGGIASERRFRNKVGLVINENNECDQEDEHDAYRDAGNLERLRIAFFFLRFPQGLERLTLGHNVFSPSIVYVVLSL
jgi:hypothetical protein